MSITTTDTITATTAASNLVVIIAVFSSYALASTGICNPVLTTDGIALLSALQLLIPNTWHNINSALSPNLLGPPFLSPSQSISLAYNCFSCWGHKKNYLPHCLTAKELCLLVRTPLKCRGQNWPE